MNSGILKYFFWGLILLFIFSGCKYSKPLTSIRISKYTKTDSTSNKTTKVSHYNYLSLRKFAILGGFTKKQLIDSDGDLIREIYTKKTPLRMFDGHVKTNTKIKYFDSNGDLTHIEFKIHQNIGQVRELIERKINYYKDGKVIRKVDKLKK